ncbi:N-6 DNA methylase [Moraxella osloensis]|uniref:N-6 DNA methylase n=1 Tax=Faucicola osloensis TaxID=34062 RepID=UPI002005D1FA|nr:N-6 DNA methylase [Moraxella osloensis]MCK6159111.1 N-6 DNA methylase [Moraxella osloensis]
MIDPDNFKQVLIYLGFTEINNIFTKSFNNQVFLTADFNNNTLIYPEDKGMTINERQTCNFSQKENFVVFECVHRLLNQGYKPEHIELEPRWQLGHGASGGRADILVKDNSNNALLIIECKTAGTEFNKAWAKTLQDGGQLLSYVQQEGTTQFVSLYASDLVDSNVQAKYYLISLKDNDELVATLEQDSDASILTFREAKTRTVETIYQAWKQTYQQDFATKGLFEAGLQAYQIGKTEYNLQDLAVVSSQDIQGKYHQFATILRQHNVSGRENAFDKLVNLFLCKIVDEKNNPDKLHFYWKGISYDNPFDLQDRLQALYQIGMLQFLGEEVTYIKDKDVEQAFRFYKNDPNETQKAIREMFRKLKFFTNNDFAFIDVHNQKLFQQNSAVLLKMVQMLQDIRLTTEQENQFLGDMFEGFLDQGVKQSEGQFFTPMPIVKFILKSLPLADVIHSSDDIPKAIDYACGAGHFLNEYATEVKQLLEQTKSEQMPSEFYAQTVGIEKEYRLSKVAKVSAFMYGQDDIQIVYADALAKNDDIKHHTYHILVANPPYSVKGFLDTLSPTDRRQYRLINSIEEKSFDVNNAIETFFIERAEQLLKTDGVAGIIVPSSILSKGKANSTSQSKNVYVATREILLENFDIVAIAEFGSGTFGKTGTNTVTLFLRRKTVTDPTQANHYRQRVNDWFNPFENPQNSIIYADEHFIREYCEHLDLNFEDYKTLLQSQPNDDLLTTEYFTAYQSAFDKSTEIKNLKKSKLFKQKSETEKKYELLKRFVNYLQKVEKDKLYYFVLASTNPQPVLIVKSPNTNKEMKKFLGYEWSSAKGNEGIKYLGGVIDLPVLETVDDDNASEIEDEDSRILQNMFSLNSINTPLYDPKNNDNPEKINYLIRENFLKNPVEIPESLKDFVTQARLIDMLDFSIVDFNKSLSLTPKRNLHISTKWDIKLLGDLVAINSHSINPENYLNENFIYVDIDSVGKGSNLVKFDNTLLGKDLPSRARRIAERDSIVISTVRPYLKGFLYIDFEPKQMVFSTGFAILKSLDTQVLNNKFIFELFFNSDIVMFQIQNAMPKSSYPSINSEDIKNFKIPLPPIDIQQKIIDECQLIDDEVNKARQAIDQANQQINQLFTNSLNNTSTAKRLSNNEDFEIGIGKRVLASQIEEQAKDGYLPVYSANVFDIFGYINDSLIDNFELPSVLWGIDGDWMTNYLPKKYKFYPTDHCGYIRTKTDEINPKFLTWLLYQAGQRERFSRSHRASIERIKNLTLSFPSIDIQNAVVEQVIIFENQIKDLQNVINEAHDKKRVIIESYL